jgi:mono/diheme cytochrome c family protein
MAVDVLLGNNARQPVTNADRRMRADRPPTAAAPALATVLGSLLALALTAAAPLSAQSPVTPTPSGGALLYQTHCIACHDKQVHWRDARLATDWKSLAAQVRRWRTNTGLQWSEQEVDEVVRYLNETIYRFPDEAPRQVG